MTVAGGFLLTGIDLHAGMPTYWVLTEGPPVTIFGVVITWLAVRLPDLA